MNPLTPSLYPELREQCREAEALGAHMVMAGHPTWELGPCCSRDHAFRLHDLQKAARKFLKALSQPKYDAADYARIKQALCSELKKKP